MSLTQEKFDLPGHPPPREIVACSPGSPVAEYGKGGLGGLRVTPLASNELFLCAVKRRAWMNVEVTDFQTGCAKVGGETRP
jgi:hypothetical protein